MHPAHRSLTRKLYTVIIVTTTSLALAGLGFALPASADQISQNSPAQSDSIGAHTHQIHGTVVSDGSGNSFVVSTERYGDITVTFAGYTLRGHGHGLGHAHSFEVTKATDLKKGERVIVLGSTSADSTASAEKFTARRVHVLPTPEATSGEHATHLVGTIDSVSTTAGVTTLKLDLADKTTPTVTLAADSRIRGQGSTVADLKPGERVTVVVKNGVATGVVIMGA
jgi:hypothetical protein